ncbi:hypothetical protein H0H81_002849 [Sphagnurus paluster]|uniref:Transmembrane protein n=1 Tax=Sphagnurus paluster TaxID=117069 RepID=A0A9P7K4G6_9AGAR|nr:hypothetical protein H0H81_002849 [Sphagnurus paluster]
MPRNTQTRGAGIGFQQYVLILTAIYGTWSTIGHVPVAAFTQFPSMSIIAVAAVCIFTLRFFKWWPPGMRARRLRPMTAKLRIIAIRRRRARRSQLRIFYIWAMIASNIAAAFVYVQFLLSGAPAFIPWFCKAGGAFLSHLALRLTCNAFIEHLKMELASVSVFVCGQGCRTTVYGFKKQWRLLPQPSRSHVKDILSLLVAIFNATTHPFYSVYATVTRLARTTLSLSTRATSIARELLATLLFITQSLVVLCVRTLTLLWLLSLAAHVAAKAFLHRWGPSLLAATAGASFLYYAILGITAATQGWTQHHILPRAALRARSPARESVLDPNGDVDRSGETPRSDTTDVLPRPENGTTHDAPSTDPDNLDAPAPESDFEVISPSISAGSMPGQWGDLLSDAEVEPIPTEDVVAQGEDAFLMNNGNTEARLEYICSAIEVLAKGKGSRAHIPRVARNTMRYRSVDEEHEAEGSRNSSHPAGQDDIDITTPATNVNAPPGIFPEDDTDVQVSVAAEATQSGLRDVRDDYNMALEEWDAGLGDIEADDGTAAEESMTTRQNFLELGTISQGSEFADAIENRGSRSGERGVCDLDISDEDGEVVELVAIWTEDHNNAPSVQTAEAEVVPAEDTVVDPLTEHYNDPADTGTDVTLSNTLASATSTSDTDPCKDDEAQFLYRSPGHLQCATSQGPQTLGHARSRPNLRLEAGCWVSASRSLCTVQWGAEYVAAERTPGGTDTSVEGTKTIDTGVGDKDAGTDVEREANRRTERHRARRIMQVARWHALNGSMQTNRYVSASVSGGQFELDAEEGGSENVLRGVREHTLLGECANDAGSAGGADVRCVVAAIPVSTVSGSLPASSSLSRPAFVSQGQCGARKVAVALKDAVESICEDGNSRNPNTAPVNAQEDAKIIQGRRGATSANGPKDSDAGNVPPVQAQTALISDAARAIAVPRIAVELVESPEALGFGKDKLPSAQATAHTAGSVVGVTVSSSRLSQSRGLRASLHCSSSSSSPRLRTRTSAPSITPTPIAPAAPMPTPTHTSLLHPSKSYVERLEDEYGPDVQLEEDEAEIHARDVALSLSLLVKADTGKDGEGARARSQDKEKGRVRTRVFSMGSSVGGSGVDQARKWKGRESRDEEKGKEKENENRSLSMLRGSEFDCGLGKGKKGKGKEKDGALPQVEDVSPDAGAGSSRHLVLARRRSTGR